MSDAFDFDYEDTVLADDLDGTTRLVWRALNGRYYEMRGGQVGTIEESEYDRLKALEARQEDERRNGLKQVFQPGIHGVLRFPGYDDIPQLTYYLSNRNYAYVVRGEGKPTRISMQAYNNAYEEYHNY